MDKGSACCQVSPPNLDPQDPNDDRREPTPASCPVFHTCTRVHVPTQLCTHINKSEKKFNGTPKMSQQDGSVGKACDQGPGQPEFDL